MVFEAVTGRGGTLSDTEASSDAFLNLAQSIAASARRRYPNLNLSIPSLFAFTDPVRTPDPLAFATGLPQNIGLIYRHYGAEDREAIARALVKIAQDKGLCFFVSQDAALAQRIGAYGVHLPERALDTVQVVRAQYPQLVISAACHTYERLAALADIAPPSWPDIVFVSPIFSSQSPSAQNVTPIGAEGIRPWSDISPIPLFGLGGIRAETITKLDASGLSGFGAIDAFL